MPSSVARPFGLRFTLRLATLFAAFRARRVLKAAAESGCGLKPARFCRLAHGKSPEISQCARKIAPPRAGVSNSPALFVAGLRIVRGGARANYSKRGGTAAKAARASGTAVGSLPSACVRIASARGLQPRPEAQRGQGRAGAGARCLQPCGLPRRPMVGARVRQVARGVCSAMLSAFTTYHYVTRFRHVVKRVTSYNFR